MRIFAVSLFFVLFHYCLWAQTDSTQVSSVEEMNKERQNPVSGLRSVYLQDIIMPVGEGTANLTSIQPVYPFKITDKVRLVTYTIIPIQFVPPLAAGGDHTSGLGNILLNGYFSPVKKEGQALTWGFGPAVQLPTRTDPLLGSNRVSLGPSALLFYSFEKITIGGVIQNFWSLGGDEANKVNWFSFQYTATYNLEKAWFLLSNATIQSNWLAAPGEEWIVPVAGGAGKTFQIGSKGLYYCATAQLAYNAVKPDIIGDWQGILQFQIIF